MALFSFGEILYDVYPERKCIGGAPLNFAAHFALQGNETYMVSAVGDDENGRLALEWMQAKMIRTDYVKIAATPTGACLVTLDADGLPSYDLQKGVAWDEIDGFAAGAGSATDAAGKTGAATTDAAGKTNSAETSGANASDPVLYFGTLALRSEHNFASLRSILANNSFREVFVDINLRAPFYSDEVIRFAMENATILKISDEELAEVTRAVGITNSFFYEKNFMQMAEMFPSLKLILLTMGPNGSCAYDCVEEITYQCPASEAEVVSTVGAGDSFSAGFLSEYLKGASVDFCLSKASDIAAYVCSKLDAVPEL